MPLVLELAETDFQLNRRVAGLVGSDPNKVTNGKEHRLLIYYDAGIRGDTDLTICEFIQGRNGILRSNGQGK